MLYLVKTRCEFFLSNNSLCINHYLHKANQESNHLPKEMTDLFLTFAKSEFCFNQPRTLLRKNGMSGGNDRTTVKLQKGLGTCHTDFRNSWDFVLHPSNYYIDCIVTAVDW